MPNRPRKPRLFPPPKRHPYDQWAPDARALDLVGDKWTLLIVRDLAGGPRRFVELQRVLPGISTEQLRSRLNRMVADGLLTRQRYREVPPRVDYELTERAYDLLPVLGEIARWGYRWAWGTPRRGEAVAVGAILRLAPGLVAPRRGLSGSVLCTFTRRGREHRYLLSASRGEVRVEDRNTAEGAPPQTEAPKADATVSGPEQDWVAAFAPGGSLSELSIEGNSGLARELLGGLRDEAAAAASRAA